MNETLRQEGDSRALAERRGQLNEKGIGPLFMTLLLLLRNFSQYTYSICSDVLFSLSDLVMAKTQAKVYTYNIRNILILVPVYICITRGCFGLRNAKEFSISYR